MTERDVYADLGATTQKAMGITETSMDIVWMFVPDETLNDQLRQKTVHLTGDIEFQRLIRCQNDPVVAGARAVLDERPVVTDITMVRADIAGCGHNCQMRKAIGNGAELTAGTGTARTAATVLKPDKEDVYNGAIAVVGNTPTAALTLCDYIENGTRPTAIVAAPVGFMRAEGSRERIRDIAGEYGMPAVTNVGRHGGSGLAAALTNELIHVTSDVRNGGVDLVSHK